MFIVVCRYNPTMKRAVGCRRGVPAGAWVCLFSYPTTRKPTEYPLYHQPGTEHYRAQLDMLSPRHYRSGVRISPRKILADYWRNRNA